MVSLVSNATPFFGASYTLIATTELIAFGFSVDAFVLVVFVTAAGAAIGKLVIYGTAKGFKGRLSRNKNVRLLERWLQDRRFLIAVFVAAVVPLLPLDDYIYIGAGAAKTRLAPMFSVTIAAKLIKSAFEIGTRVLWNAQNHEYDDKPLRPVTNRFLRPPDYCVRAYRNIPVQV